MPEYPEDWVTLEEWDKYSYLDFMELRREAELDEEIRLDTLAKELARSPRGVREGGQNVHFAGTDRQASGATA